MPESNSSSIRLLLVEDDRVLQKIALRTLQSLGYQADIANDGLEAVQTASAKSYDIVFMDLGLPRMGGLEAARQISQRKKADGSPDRPPVIIALTAERLQGDFERYQAAGFSDAVAKPVQTEDLKRAIEKWTANSLPSPRSIAADQIPAGDGLAAPSSIDPPVDLERLREMTEGNLDSMRELVRLFLGQTGLKLTALGEAVAAGDLNEVYRLAHFCAGSSVSCGMTALAAPLRELEQQAHNGVLSSAPALLVQCHKAMDVTRAFLAGHVANE